MLKKKRFYVLGMLCIGLGAHPVQGEVLGDTTFQNKIIENKAIQDEEETYIKVLMQEVWGMSEERYYTFIQDETALSQTELARITCYILQLSPIYNEQRDENPYITRLKLEGLWIEQLENENVPISVEVVQAFLEKVKVYRQSKTYESFYKAVPMGFLQKSTMQLEVEGVKVPLYYLGDVNYVSLTDLKQIGFEANLQNNYLSVTFDKEKFHSPISELAEKTILINQVVQMNPQKVYVGNILTYSLKVGGETLIPLRSMSDSFTLGFEGAKCLLQEQSPTSKDYIDLKPGKIHNISQVAVDVTVISLFWNGKELLEEEMTINQLMPGEYYVLNEALYTLDKSTTHISTIVTQIQSDSMKMNNAYKSYGQHTESVLKTYTLNQNTSMATYIEKLFPVSKIIGTVKYDNNGFVKGEKVDVWAAESGKYYYLIKNGKKITVPWGSVSIPPNPEVGKDQVPKNILEGFVNSQGIKSKTPYFIWTDLYRQKTYVFENKSGQWQLLRTMPTSTGNNRTPTPTGEFEVNAYVPAFGMNKGYRCKNALHLFGDYLYHSVMFDVEGKYVLGGQGKLGERASHGCLRLSPENSEWLYKTMPLGTKVLIR